MKKELIVSALKNGTVIDHIPSDALFKVINVLKLDRLNGEMITFGTNLYSKQFGKKAIIKISDMFFEDTDINKIALFAPNAVLNIIKDYEVIEKHLVEMPVTIQGIVKCQNPVCITNNEAVKPRFDVLQEAPIVLRCSYCEKITEEKNLKLIE